MPSGVYALHDPRDGTPLGTEHFSCAPGPAGWRYTADRRTPSGEPAGAVDLTIDALGRPVRLEVRTTAWWVRGGIDAGGLRWVRGDTGGHDAREGHVPGALAFTGTSPAHLVALARLAVGAGVRAGAGPGIPADTVPGAPARRFRLVELTEPVLGPLTVDRLLRLEAGETHRAPDDPDTALTVHRWRLVDPADGEGRDIHLGGDVVLAAPGVELEELDGPPGVFPPPPGSGGGPGGEDGDGDGYVDGPG
ncbi:hypothetical protein [Streptomyces sp. ST2-7A]|uniref:hypothetical protein n=1 Tax=Streptomyces sp. ST2-7A TaxID=2907214 RepID=UPI001F27493D|nr:hypothetical protein [Streptomyces sp. ST2-7A]MCE7083270.1 hypothetical protein [Streptomyces sp. ST2-7A]